jgi:hypothetical protein
VKQQQRVQQQQMMLVLLKVRAVSQSHTLIALLMFVGFAGRAMPAAAAAATATADALAHSAVAPVRAERPSPLQLYTLPKFTKTTSTWCRYSGQLRSDTRG